MKKGLNQWCFPTTLTIADIFHAAANAGFDGVELNLGRVGAPGLHLETTLAEARAIGRLAQSLQLELPSLATDLLWAFPLSAPDATTRQSAREIVLKQLELASTLEMGTILVVPGVVTRDCGYADCYRRSQEELAGLASRASELGVHIGIENVWNKFLLSPPEMAAFIDGCNSPWIGSYLDVGNVLVNGYPEDWITTLGPRISSVHVKDFLESVGNIHGFVPLFSGDVRWSDVRAALAAIGYDGYLIAEVGPPSVGQQRFLEDTARALTDIIGCEVE